MKPKSKLLGKKDGYFQKAAKKSLLCIIGTHIANADNTPKLLSINFQDKVQFQLLGETKSSQYNTLKQLSNLLSYYRHVTWDPVNTHPI